MEQQSLTSGLDGVGGILRSRIPTIPSRRVTPGNWLVGPDRASTRAGRLEAVGPGFPGDPAEAAGSCAAAGRGGMEKLGVELEEESGLDEEEDAALAMEQAEAGAAVSSPSVPGPAESGGLPCCK